MFGHRPTSVSAAEGARAGAEGQVVIYWRKGCPFTKRLRLVLGKRGAAAVWVDIWADADAAAYVRSVNDGNETVPTVVIDGEPHTNPAPRLVVAALSRQA
ncbi:glutaredoxin domain-containing protein [Nocardioides allogilvus]|uniref:glutaredoxin domain-containing protein n=1 Tax=Nocardioides allogilvus TaxID=2072017 RepID=UPI000D30E6BA|nr:glutaredoxin domain-containing protein [Nocardioides allogilvus]